jgi:hypothetical protein
VWLTKFHESLRFRPETEKTRLDLINTDLDVCLTFAAMVETEHRRGNREHAEQILAKAEKGYSDMFRFFSEATGLTPEVKEKLQSKFQQLRDRLDSLKRLE